MKTILRSLLMAGALLVAAPATASAQSGGLPAVSSTDRIMGRANAPVTVIEYASFVCSHCAA